MALMNCEWSLVGSAVSVSRCTCSKISPLDEEAMAELYPLLAAARDRLGELTQALGPEAAVRRP